VQSVNCCVAENAVPDTSFNERLGNVSGARQPASLSDFNSCRYFGNVTSSLMAQITELEGPRYEYRQLFHQAATERMVSCLLGYTCHSGFVLLYLSVSLLLLKHFLSSASQFSALG